MPGCCVQTFIKAVNYQHIMPTRYTLDVDLKSCVPADVLGNQERKEEARKVSSQPPPPSSDHGDVPTPIPPPA